MPQETYIWISRWEDFQHYKPERDRGPAWIKQHVAQLHDERYLALTMVQRALLHDLRLLFSAYRGRLSSDTRALTHKVGHKVTSGMLEALNHAGLIEIVSREVLDARLEKLYTLPRARARSREVDLEVEEDPPLPPQTRGAKTDVSTGKRESRKRVERAEAFVKNAGVQYEPLGFEEELAKFGLDPDEYQRVHDLYDHLRPQALAIANGADPQDELPWEGEEPPVVA